MDLASTEWNAAKERAYIVQIAGLGRSALVNLAELVEVAGLRPPHPDEWRCLADFLVPCGRISRFFYPAQDQRSRRQTNLAAFRKNRGAKLRELFNVGPGWPLSDRKVRNAEEHFDERFDEWQMRQPQLSAEYLNASKPTRTGSPPLRLIDRKTWTVTVAGQTLELVPVHRELQRLVRRCCEVEPLAKLDDPQLAYLLATLPDLPTELTLAAPTQRPQENVLAGVEGGVSIGSESATTGAGQGAHPGH